MTWLLSSPLFPPDESGQALKGRFDSNSGSIKLATITPLRGKGVSKYNNTF